jgi:hypothetical protein
LRLPGLLELVFVRSDYAHANINSIDLSAALAAPGVVAAWDGERVTFSYRPRSEETDGGGARTPADDLARRRLSPALAAACADAPDAGRAVVWAVPSQPRCGPGRLSCGAWPAAAGGASSAGLADGVCAAGGRPSRTVSHLWPAARVYGCHPAGRGSSPPILGGVRRMRFASLGSPTRGVVCLGTARGRFPQPGGSPPGWSWRQGRPSFPHVRGRPGQALTG